MQIKKSSIIIVSFMISKIYAITNQNLNNNIPVHISSSIPNAMVTKNINNIPNGLHDNNLKAIASNPNETVRSKNNLSEIDNTTEDLIKLKRKLEVEKAQNEIKKLKNGGYDSSGNFNENAQTTVTGVAINQEGKKIAWLQFTDGGSLTVNVSSKVGKYIVDDINMSGVKLSYYTGKKHTIKHSIFLKRIYLSEEKINSQANSNSSIFAPSPVITGANTSNNEIVPPIISVK